jgi:serpin B
VAKLGGVDFKKPGSAQTINDWADKSTRGKIKNVVQWPLPSFTRMILANAIYFKGKWERPFDTNATKPHAFHPAGGGKKQAPTMWQRGRFSYQAGDGYQAVRLPYAGERLRMHIFLPDTNSSPAKVLAGLNGETWRDKILPQFTERQGTLALPRFKLNYDVELNHPLEALGMRIAFTPAADFSAMAGEPLHISAVKQKSFADVNEEGTEAAAVTTVMMKSLAIMTPAKPFEMIVDRPFLLVIVDDETGSILFMGVVSDPVK